MFDQASKQMLDKECKIFGNNIRPRSNLRILVKENGFQLAIAIYADFSLIPFKRKESHYPSRRAYQQVFTLIVKVDLILISRPIKWLKPHASIFQLIDEEWGCLPTI